MHHFTDMLDRDLEMRRDVNNRDLFDMTQAVVEIERTRNMMDYLCNSYRQLVKLKIKNGENVEEMLALLERINNAQNQKAS